MSGRWVRILEPAHECDPPAPGIPTGIGSIWRCECGKTWEYTGQVDGLFQNIIFPPGKAWPE